MSENINTSANWFTILSMVIIVDALGKNKQTEEQVGVRENCFYFEKKLGAGPEKGKYCSGFLFHVESY